MSDAIEHPTFGTMSHEDDHPRGWLARKVRLTPKHHVRVVVMHDPDEDPPLPQVLDQAVAIFERIRQEEHDYRMRVTDELLDPYNRGWRREGDPVLDREGFWGKLALARITLAPSGEFSLAYSDGGARLFGSNFIVANTDASGAIESITFD